MKVYYPVDWGKETDTKISKEILLRIARLFLPYTKWGILVLACITVEAGLQAVQPIFIKEILDKAIPTGNFGQLNLLILGLILLPVIGGFVSVGQNYLNTMMGQQVMFDLRTRIYQHLMKMSLNFFTSTKTGDVISRLNNDVNGLQNVITETIGSFFQNTIRFFAILGVMFFIDWRLTLLSLLILPAFILPTKKIARLNYLAKKESQEKLGEITSIVQETMNISGAMLIKAFGSQSREAEKFRERNKELKHLNIRQSMIGRWFFMVLRVITNAGPAVIYWYGGYLVIGGEITIGTVVVFTAYLNKLLLPVSAMANLHVNIKGSVALFERLFEYMDLPVEVTPKTSGVEISQINDKIEFEQVSFSYAGHQVIKDISFSIRPGEMVGLVGPSGAGKSTIGYLLSRFYDPDHGKITIDKHDLREINPASLHQLLGVVLQETVLFHATIKENLLYAKPHATDQEIEEAAQKAFIHDFIVSLPDGYDTVVGERGHKLSGGEKQRISIARVILKNPEIIIFDEATSSLDSHSENLIQQAMKPLLAHRTSLVIAHRLSTIMEADQILVVNQGEICERGTHTELMAKNGLYASLFREQYGKGQVQS